MKIENIKPIPKYMLRKIHKKDLIFHPTQNGLKRFYSYFTKNAGELVKVTVCCKNHKGIWHCKQVAVHGIDSKICFVKDMYFNNISGYSVGWHDEGLSKYPSWYEGNWGWTEDKYFDPFAPIVNIEYVLAIDEFKYSAVDKHHGDDVMKYLRMYRQYPQIEYLTKLGLHHYALKKQILELAGKDKGFRRYLARNAAFINRPNGFYVCSVIKAYKTGNDIEEIDRQEKMVRDLCSGDRYEDIKDVCKGKLTQVVDYLYEQGINARLYADYIHACKELGIDLDEGKNVFPKDFRRWHDIRIDEYRTKKAVEDEQKRKDFYDQFLSISTKYFNLEHHNNSFAVIIAKTPAELTHEGEALHHCVGKMGYDQKFVREESLIFFLRCVADINSPFVTIEYSPKKKKMLQCYGEHNTTPNTSVLDYLNNNWLPYAKKQLKKIAA